MEYFFIDTLSSANVWLTFYQTFDLVYSFYSATTNIVRDFSIFMSKVIADCSRKNNYSIAVLNDADELEYFSFENNQKKTIKSNIYLGKITRVEYSLQAAFVEYGGDKAGFLPFAEIHPNYYHIPTRDKQELLKHSRYGRIDDIDEDENNDINFKTTQKKYAIQEVIKRGQVVLVQVTKDERGNKGKLWRVAYWIPQWYAY